MWMNELVHVLRFVEVRRSLGAGWAFYKGLGSRGYIDIYVSICL